MTGVTIIVPTIGRPELGNCLAALSAQTQSDDRVMVMVDDPAVYTQVVNAVDLGGRGIWRAYPPLTGQLGQYGHPQRNRALDLLAELEDRPDWVWSVDDDDEPAFGALDFIRTAIAEGPAWLLFAMRGGDSSHFPGITVPTMGHELLKGNVGTPMIVAPVCKARWGAGSFDRHGPGYFGDWELALALNRELGAPIWNDAVVAEVRPSR